MLTESRRLTLNPPVSPLHYVNAAENVADRKKCSAYKPHVTSSLTCPKSMVRLTLLYLSPRESGGLCHHLSDPSMANSGLWEMVSLLGSHLQHSWPCSSMQEGSSNICGVSMFLLAPTSVQYVSGSERDSPQVAVASMRRPGDQKGWGWVRRGWKGEGLKTG